MGPCLGLSGFCARLRRGCASPDPFTSQLVPVTTGSRPSRAPVQALPPPADRDCGSDPFLIFGPTVSIFRGSITCRRCAPRAEPNSPPPRPPHWPSPTTGHLFITPTIAGPRPPKAAGGAPQSFLRVALPFSPGFSVPSRTSPLCFLSTTPRPSVLLSRVQSSKGAPQNTCLTPTASSRHVACGYTCGHLRLSRASARAEVCPLRPWVEGAPFNPEMPGPSGQGRGIAHGAVYPPSWRPDSVVNVGHLRKNF